MLRVSALLLLAASINGFTFVPPPSACLKTPTSLRSTLASTEPPSGTLLTEGLEYAKVKDLGPDADKPEYNSYRLQSKAFDGDISKIKTQVLKDASSKAQFPGFRKGQIPPYAMPQMVMFSLQEAITNALEATISSYRLETPKGSDGNIDVKEKVEDMAKSYKGGDVEFTATFLAKPKV